MKKTYSKIIFVFIFLFIILAFQNIMIVNGSNDISNSSYISSISIIKNSVDKDNSPYINEKSLPFTIIINLVDKSIHRFNQQHTLLLFNSSFKSTSGKYEFAYDDFKNAFILTNIVYDGVSNAFPLALSDGENYYEYYFETIFSALISGNNNIGDGGKDGSISEGKSKADSSDSDKISIPASLKPNVILSGHSINFKNNSLDFDLTLEFYNTSQKITAQNILINLSPEKYDSKSKNLYLNNSDSNKYIEKIEPGKKSKITVSCSLNKESEFSIYLLSITADFQYTDKKDKDPINGTNKSILTINPKIKGDLRIDSLHLPEEIIIDKDFNLEYRLANIGLTSITNVDILITDDEDKKVATMFIGKINSNAAISKPDIKLNIKKAGIFKLNFNVSYIDENNINHTITKIFTMKINEDFDEDINDATANPTIIIEKKGGLIDKNIVTGMLLAVIFFVTFYIIKKILSKDIEKETDELKENFKVNNLDVTKKD